MPSASSSIAAVTSPVADPSTWQVPSAAGPFAAAEVVIVDDDPEVLEVLRIYLEEAGYRRLTLVNDSSRVLDLLRVSSPALLITDLRMPKVTGFDLLASVRGDRRLQHLPVLVLTSSSDAATKLKALEMGATDFLAKPVDASELVLRLKNNLAVQAYQEQLRVARRESEHLLTSILPEPVAERLKRGEVVADYFEEATVLFADLVGFTGYAARAEASTVVEQLNVVFSLFDQVVHSRGLEKIKTIGDAYMLAGGVPTPRSDHAAAVVEAGLSMLAACDRLRAQGRANFQLRIGVHTGPVMAGVIGSTKFAYDLWGDTVNVASRMESLGVAGRVQISGATRAALGDDFNLTERRALEVKGKGTMTTWFVDGLRS